MPNRTSIHTIPLPSYQSTVSSSLSMACSKLSKGKLAAIALLLDEEEEEERTRKKRRRRVWVNSHLQNRKTKGEYWTLFKELIDDEVKFYEYFRMPRSQFYFLLHKIEKDLRKQNTTFREAISPEEKLAVFLRYLVTGDSFKTISFSYCLGHSTVHNIVNGVCDAITKNLKDEVMPTPTEETWKKIAADNLEMWNFPNCIGAIDGKHIKIQAPPNSGSQFYNCKQIFSIVLFALVDANCRFIVVDIGSFGKNSDGGIFSHSKLGEALEKGTLNIPQEKELPGTSCLAPHVIVGDEAFPLKTYLMRPYPGSQINDDDQKGHFNYRLSRFRRVVENAFGIMTNKFRFLLRTFNLLPENVNRIVFATCLLHNFIQEQNVTADQNINNFTNDNIANMVDIPRQGGRANQDAFNVREKFKEYFSSPTGSLPWQ